MVAEQENRPSNGLTWVTWLFVVLFFITAGTGYYFFAQQQHRIQVLQQAVEQANDKVTNLSEQLRASNLQQESLRQEAEFANRTNTTQRQQLSEFEQKLTELREERDRLETVNREQLNELNDRKRQLDLALSNVTSANRKVEEYQQQLAALQNNLTGTQQRLQALSGELTAKQASLMELSSIEDQYHAAREQLALQQAQNEDYTATISQLEDQLKREGKAMDQLEQKLNRISDEKETLVSKLRDGTTVIKLPEKILFASGSADLNAKGEKTLRLVAEALSSFPDHMISIQGHTDGRAITSRLRDHYPSNWELSSARASAAVRVLLDAGLDKSRLQAVGYADTRPLVDEKNDDDRANNRRIEIYLVPVPVNTRELVNTKDD
ncbi:OmpA/MotB family protein [Gynuella sunshinyii]|uniref:Flagellar motor protein n=1 Tax=Gynuella sunshinyii YC6258 TaxID=1445510 RepID=A0A0C5VRY3_9GAMM|nr:OmpA family protein [Gynuella sunshinyii]AJQ97402.1 flagellar motor protein [Gynuella sunshinyii YC6258]